MTASSRHTHDANRTSTDGPKTRQCDLYARQAIRRWAAPAIREVYAARPGLLRPAAPALAERPLVCRGPVERRNGNVVEPEIHRQLPAVMNQVIQRAVAQRDVARLLRHHVAL